MEEERVRGMKERDLEDDLSLRRPEHSDRALESENVKGRTTFLRASDIL